MSHKILFNDNEPISPEEISNCIKKFGDSYTKAVTKIIRETDGLDLNIDIFIKNSAGLLNSFKMARSGPFKGIGVYNDKVVGPVRKLRDCWDAIYEDLLYLQTSGSID